MKWPWRRAETRAVMTQRDLSLVEALGVDRHFGQVVSAISTEFLSAAVASIDAISATVSTLPAFVYRTTDTGREEDPNHPLARIVRDGPNDHQSWPDFVQWLVAETLRHGNGVAEKVYDDAGRLIGFQPLPADRRGIMLLPNGRLRYDYVDPATLQMRRLLDDEVLHLRDRSDDGLIGRPRHHRASPVIAAALALERHSGSLHANGAFPGAAVEIEGKIDQGGIDRLKEQIKAMFAGPEKSGRAIILPGGKWSPITASPVDQEIVAARRFAGEEVARIYGVPAPIINDLTHGSFANVNDLLRLWAQGTVQQWCRKIEAEFQRSALSGPSRRSHALVLDLSGLLRGDPAQRWAAWKIAADGGILTPNEIREEEGFNPIAGGDTLRAAGGTSPGGAPVAATPNAG